MDVGKPRKNTFLFKLLAANLMLLFSLIIGLPPLNKTIFLLKWRGAN